MRIQDASDLTRRQRQKACDGAYVAAVFRKQFFHLLSGGRLGRPCGSLAGM